MRFRGENVMIKRDNDSFLELESSVLAPGVCSGCSSCVIACPTGVLAYVNGTPSLCGECKSCGLCLEACPRYKDQGRRLDEYIFKEPTDKEAIPWGNYLSIVVARAADEEVSARGQDAGVVSALLIRALDTGGISGAVLSGLSAERPQYPRPAIAQNRGEVLAAAGSRYTYSANLLALKNAVKAGLSSVALVGTPCQITAWRQLQHSGLKKYAGIVNCAIGLFCSKSFSYEGLIEEKLGRQLGIDIAEINGFQIKGKFTVSLRSGEIREIPLKEIQMYARSGCLHCHDFTAEYADISVGSIGLNGWNLIILRTDRGKDLYDKAVESGVLEERRWEDFPESRNLLDKLARQQRHRA